MYHTQPSSFGVPQRLIALSHQKLEYLSYLPVDAPVLLRSVLIFNAIQVAELTGNAQRLREEEWFENTLGQLDNDEGEVAQAAPESTSMTPPAPSPVAVNSSDSSAIVQVQEVDDDEDESDEEDEEMSSLVGSVDSLLSFTMEDTEHNHTYSTTSPPATRPASPRHSSPPQLSLPLPVATNPLTSIDPFDDLSDDEDDDDGQELVTPPQPALLDDFDTPCDGHSTDDFNWNAGYATQGLQLFV